MENHPARTTTDRERRWGPVGLRSLEERTASAFTVGGGLLIASMVVPVGLQPVTEQAWALGLGLAGLAVAAIAVGLLGMYPRVEGRASRLGTAGVLGGSIAGAAGIALIGMATIGLLGEAAMGMDLGTPKTAFVAIGLSMAGGTSLGLLSFGAAGWRTGNIPRVTSQLLLLGGLVLFVPVVGEILRRGLGMGVPSWIVFPALLWLALDALAVGQSLRSAA